MSCDKWRWTEECDHRPCPGDCDLCDYDDTYTVEEPTISCMNTYERGYKDGYKQALKDALERLKKAVE